MAIVDIDHKINELLPSGIAREATSFAIAFLDVFKKGFKGNARKKLLACVDNKSNFSDGLLLRNAIHYKPTTPGADLQNTLNELQAAKENLKNKVRYLLTYDGTMLAARDVVEGDSIVCSLNDLKHEFFFFSVLYGEPRYVAAEENKADQDAAIALSKVYSALKASDPEWAIEHGHDVNTFMTRLLFCLFAEDTDLFEKDLFTKTLVARGGKYGGHAQSIIGDIYRMLNTPENKRVGEPEWLRKFPYVNGDVFALDGIHIPKFNIQAFHYLKEAGETIDWKEVHPDILGSAIQKITDPSERHSLGMHYTSVTNIDKLLGPLFIDELREARVKANASGVRRIGNLQKLLGRIGQIKVFDPACGSGNFLVIAYKRLRELEIQLLNDLQDAGLQQVDLFSQITLENFYGIEYADFAAETAKVSLRIAEQQMDAVYGEQFNKPASILPLRAAPNIHTGSALTVPWEEACPATKDCEIYICGNPPYLGFSGRSSEQQTEHDTVMDGVFKSVSQLDYVCNWFVLASRFITGIPKGRYAFVSTNSITQGIHVPRLWPYILNLGLEIKFAYPSFKWSNLAGNNAGVTCVIIGVGHQDTKSKRLFTKDGEIQAGNINPYLSDAPTAWIQTSNTPISLLPSMVLGSAPKDGGNLILLPDEMKAMINSFPQAEKFIRRLIGSQEMLKDIERYCLWIENEDLEEAMIVPPIAERIEKVRQMRLSSKKAATRKSASRPHEFDENRHRESKYTIVIPSHSSGHRFFIPVNSYNDGEVVNNSAFTIQTGNLWVLSILTSTLHRVWLSSVGGKLADEFRYSNSLVWNTFPMPELSDDDKEALNKTAQKILNARHYHPDLTLGDMYNPSNMGPELLAAHEENDRVLEKIFRDKPFRNDEDRLAHLFESYAEMTQGEK
tara:strand:+ start:1141 stop:3840 length:2700 start_codon:yes stop_codon:yes gene_type:complete